MANDQMANAYVKSGGAKPKKPERAKKTLARGKGPRKESHAHALLEAKWAGIKEAFLFLGQTCAMGPKGCGGVLDLDHIIPRSKGGPYTAENAQILCRFHHQQRHGVPKWSNSAAAEGRSESP